MKTMTEIDNIICNIMTDEDFDKAQNAQYDRWDLDSRTARNGKARLTRRLARYGLTVEDWDAWGDRG